MQYVNKRQPEERDRFAATIGLILAQGLASATCLQSLAKDHLVKNGKPYTLSLHLYAQATPTLIIRASALLVLL